MQKAIAMQLPEIYTRCGGTSPGLRLVRMSPVFHHVFFHSLLGAFQSGVSFLSIVLFVFLWRRPDDTLEIAIRLIRGTHQIYDVSGD